MAIYPIEIFILATNPKSHLFIASAGIFGIIVAYVATLVFISGEHTREKNAG